MAEARAQISFKDVRASVKRMQNEGEKLVTRHILEELLNNAAVHPHFVAAEPCGRRHAAPNAAAKCSDVA